MDGPHGDAVQPLCLCVPFLWRPHRRQAEQHPVPLMEKASSSSPATHLAKTECGSEKGRHVRSDGNKGVDTLSAPQITEENRVQILQSESGTTSSLNSRISTHTMTVVKNVQVLTPCRATTGPLRSRGSTFCDKWIPETLSQPLARDQFTSPSANMITVVGAALSHDCSRRSVLTSYDTLTTSCSSNPPSALPQQQPPVSSRTVDSPPPPQHLLLQRDLTQRESANVLRMASFRRCSTNFLGAISRKPSLLGRPQLISAECPPPTTGSFSYHPTTDPAPLLPLHLPANSPPSAASSFTTQLSGIHVNGSIVELASPQLPTLYPEPFTHVPQGNPRPSATSLSDQPRTLQSITSLLTATSTTGVGGPEILSSVLSEGFTLPLPLLPSPSHANPVEQSRSQFVQQGGLLSSELLSADTGHMNNSAVEQLRQQILLEQQQGGPSVRPIEVDILEKVGQGSFGLVYRGVWQGAHVAIKYLSSSGTQQLQISATEALLSKLLAHPNVVQTFACKVVQLTPDFFPCGDDVMSDTSTGRFSGMGNAGGDGSCGRDQASWRDRLRPGFGVSSATRSHMDVEGGCSGPRRCGSGDSRLRAAAAAAAAAASDAIRSGHTSKSSRRAPELDEASVAAVATAAALLSAPGAASTAGSLWQHPSCTCAHHNGSGVAAASSALPSFQPTAIATSLIDPRGTGAISMDINMDSECASCTTCAAAAARLGSRQQALFARMAIDLSPASSCEEARASDGLVGRSGDGTTVARTAERVPMRSSPGLLRAGQAATAEGHLAALGREHVGSRSLVGTSVMALASGRGEGGCTLLDTISGNVPEMVPEMVAAEAPRAVSAAAFAAQDSQAATAVASLGSSDEKLAAVAELLKSFHSGDGFGAPYLGDADAAPPQDAPSAQYRELLGHLRARPGDFLTQIIMEFCDRGSLQRAIDRRIFHASSRWNSRVALRALLRTAREIAQGMCHLHANQIVHGDLKPANVLLKSSRADRRGFIAKVADFGLSKIFKAADGSLACHTDCTGTVAYMAPEVLNGSVSPAADVYSFGVLLWQLVTGERPFADMHPGRLFVGVASGALRLEWPADAHPMVLRLGNACLSPEKRHRPTFTKVARVLGVIETVVRNESVTATIAATAAAAAASPPARGGLGGDDTWQPALNHPTAADSILPLLVPDPHMLLSSKLTAVLAAAAGRGSSGSGGGADVASSCSCATTAGEGGGGLAAAAEGVAIPSHGSSQHPPSPHQVTAAHGPLQPAVQAQAGPLLPPTGRMGAGVARLAVDVGNLADVGTWIPHLSPPQPSLQQNQSPFQQQSLHQYHQERKEVSEAGGRSGAAAQALTATFSISVCGGLCGQQRWPSPAAAGGGGGCGSRLPVLPHSHSGPDLMHNLVEEQQRYRRDMARSNSHSHLHHHYHDQNQYHQQQCHQYHQQQQQLEQQQDGPQISAQNVSHQHSHHQHHQHQHTRWVDCKPHVIQGTDPGETAPSSRYRKAASSPPLPMLTIGTPAHLSLPTPSPPLPRPPPDPGPNHRRVMMLSPFMFGPPSAHRPEHHRPTVSSQPGCSSCAGEPPSSSLALGPSGGISGLSGPQTGSVPPPPISTLWGTYPLSHMQVLVPLPAHQARLSGYETSAECSAIGGGGGEVKATMHSGFSPHPGGATDTSGAVQTYPALPPQPQLQPPSRTCSSLQPFVRLQGGEASAADDPLTPPTSAATHPYMVQTAVDGEGPSPLTGFLTPLGGDSAAEAPFGGKAGRGPLHSYWRSTAAAAVKATRLMDLAAVPPMALNAPEGSAAPPPPFPPPSGGAVCGNVDPQSLHGSSTYPYWQQYHPHDFLPMLMSSPVLCAGVIPSYLMTYLPSVAGPAASAAACSTSACTLQGPLVRSSWGNGSCEKAAAGGSAGDEGGAGGGYNRTAGMVPYTYSGQSVSGFPPTATSGTAASWLFGDPSVGSTWSVTASTTLPPWPAGPQLPTCGPAPSAVAPTPVSGSPDADFKPQLVYDWLHSVTSQVTPNTWPLEPTGLFRAFTSGVSPKAMSTAASATLSWVSGEGRGALRRQLSAGASHKSGRQVDGESAACKGLGTGGLSYSTALGQGRQVYGGRTVVGGGSLSPSPYRDCDLSPGLLQGLQRVAIMEGDEEGL